MAYPKAFFFCTLVIGMHTIIAAAHSTKKQTFDQNTLVALMEKSVTEHKKADSFSIIPGQQIALVNSFDKDSNPYAFACIVHCVEDAEAPLQRLVDRLLLKGARSYVIDNGCQCITTFFEAVSGQPREVEIEWMLESFNKISKNKLLPLIMDPDVRQLSFCSRQGKDFQCYATVKEGKNVFWLVQINAKNGMLEQKRYSKEPEDN